MARPRRLNGRAFTFVEGTVERLTPRGPDDAFEAARAFADYRIALDDLPGPVLPDTIDRFHDLPGRTAALEAMAAADRLFRRGAVTDELERARLLAQRVETELGAITGRFPPRLVHNDAKLSNVRFDAETGPAICVVDFDTTMVGARPPRRGGARSHGQHPCRRRLRRRGRGRLRPGDGRSRRPGYLDQLAGPRAVRGHFLGVAGPEMTVENAVRFLTDHLGGDTYFADRPS